MKTGSNRQKPSNLQAIQTSRHLQVTHRRHTGHITPRHTTSYPILAMILLLVGVLLATWTNMVAAGPQLTQPISNSYGVHTKVVGTAPTKPPTITSPLTGTKFTRSPITVTGKCQVDTYIVLYRNSAFSGVGLCNEDGTYRIRTDLFVGSSTLQTRVFSPTDLPGPYSNSETVYYHPVDLPLVVAEPSSGAAAPQAPTVKVTNPLIFKSQYNYHGTYTGEPSKWVLSIEGGTPPYAISINWGDGSRELISKSSPGTFALEHTYQKAGGYKGSYYIEFAATDASRSTTFLQLLAIINDPPGKAAGSIANRGGPQNLSDIQSPADAITKYVWSGYGVSLLMLSSFWLGERRILHQMPPSKRHRHA